MDWLDLLAVQGTLKSLHHGSKASILQRSAFFMVQLSHPYMTTGKTLALIRLTFVSKVMTLLFNMLSAAAAAAKSLQSYPTLCDPRDGSPPGSPVQVDFLPAEPQGKPKNTGVGSLSLVQGIFPSQELNRGLLHCWWIPYQLSYEGSPMNRHRANLDAFHC